MNDKDKRIICQTNQMETGFNYVYLPRKQAKQDMADTNTQVEELINRCRALFADKLKDYGASWRLMRPQTVTDQLFIKASRIRSLQTGGVALVNEGIRPELMALVNYGAIALVQLELGAADAPDLSPPEALRLYDARLAGAKELMRAKNHDYNEAWRLMRTASYTDLILVKICRIKQIEDQGGQTIVSEGIDANYLDIINYALFALIKSNPDEA
jgi:hypothetical protein